MGYVKRFAVPTEYPLRYPVQQVGGRDHRELWVPAEEWSEFNAQMSVASKSFTSFVLAPHLLPKSALQQADTARPSFWSRLFSRRR